MDMTSASEHDNLHAWVRSSLALGMTKLIVTNCRNVGSETLSAWRALIVSSRQAALMLPH